MNKTYFIGILLITASLFAGCTKENTEDCFSGLRLDFYFTHHTGNGNLFGEKVRRIHVYLFDTEGILQLHATDNGDKLNIVTCKTDRYRRCQNRTRGESSLTSM